MPIACFADLQGNGEEELLRQFSERLRMHFSYVLSEPLPGDIIRLLDKLGENNR